MTKLTVLKNHLKNLYKDLQFKKLFIVLFIIEITFLIVLKDTDISFALSVYCMSIGLILAGFTGLKLGPFKSKKFKSLVIYISVFLITSFIINNQTESLQVAFVWSLSLLITLIYDRHSK